MIPGGSLGWKGKGTLMPEFEKVAFELEVSSIGSPKWAEYVSPAHVLVFGAGTDTYQMQDNRGLSYIDG
jgi:hypothetical protein